MTIKTIPFPVPHYIGASSDTKPTVDSHSGLPAPQIGSTCFEYDTGQSYITYDGTNWLPYSAPPATPAKTATVAQDETTSDAVDLERPCAFVSIAIPNITGATITLQGSHDNSNFYTVRGFFLNPAADISLTKNKFHPRVPLGCRYVKVVSASSEASARSITIQGF